MFSHQSFLNDSIQSKINKKKNMKKGEETAKQKTERGNRNKTPQQIHKNKKQRKNKIYRLPTPSK